MHLLTAQAGALQQEGEAIDLGQSPAPIVFASAADSELALIAGAVDRAGTRELRLANLLRLAHNLSVDLWLDKTVQHARLVVLRLLGGASYWSYGVEQLSALAAAGRFQLVLLPGEAVPDPVLESRSTVAPETWRRLHGLFTAGGPENADGLLSAFRELAERLLLPSPLRGGIEGGGRPLAHSSEREPPPPTPPLKGEGSEGLLQPAIKPFARFGYWLPGRRIVDEVAATDRPVVPLLFYRAAVEGAGTAVIEALCAEATRRGLRPLPLMISTLKEGACVRFVKSAFAAHRPEVILNLTGFALGVDGLEDGLNPFAGIDAPVIQLVQGGRPEAQWASDSQGLTAKDLAMQVVLPELDGRIGGILVGHKAEAVWHAATECPLSAYAPDAEGIFRAVSLAANWVRLRATPRAERRVAIVLANYPIRDGRLANGVGYDAPESTVRILRALEEAGYRTSSADFTTPTPSPSPQGGEGREAGVFGNRRMVQDKNLVRARTLRQGATPPERVLWTMLRAMEAYHFRRQVPLGPYIADFACHHPKLIIELDGHSHGANVAALHDAQRDKFLRSRGYRVLRIWNGDVTRDKDAVWRVIEATLAELSPPSPLRGGAGGGGGAAPAVVTSRPPPPIPPRKRGGGLTAKSLIELLQAGPTNAHPERDGGVPFPLARYRDLFATLPDKMQNEVVARWGDPEDDPFVRGATFHLPAVRFDNVVVMLQPARGYDRDAGAAYHDPDLVPPHAYLAAYLWMRHEFGAHAVIHNGKHGSLEWLPGKAVALDGASYPAALWGELPHFYPFIVNDPGEGTQAKRRTGAVIIDHLVPPLTRAETYGPLKDLEALLDEYYAASGMDRRRLRDLRKRILDFTRDARLDRDIGLPSDEGEALKQIDTFLCDLKEAQIRDGLHVFGESPAGRLERDLLAALARVPRGDRPEDGSIVRAIADDLGLGVDPLTAELGDAWTGPTVALDPMDPHPQPLPAGGRGAEGSAQVAFGSTQAATPTPGPSPQGEEVGARPSTSPSTDTDAALSPPSPLRGAVGGAGSLHTIRTVGDVVERLEEMAAGMIDGGPALGPASAMVMRQVEGVMRPRLRESGPAEIGALLDGLDGKFVRPGPSGAPSRGRLDVLPTGRNFYSVDNRAVPTATAWELGRKSAEALLTRHFQDSGTHLRSLALSVWGTSCMRTGGDDIAQALAFIGAKPVWDPSSLRVSGYEIIPLAKLGRPRVDVTLRISGLFRDAFPQLVTLFDRAVRAIGALDEPEDQNPVSARMRSDALGLMKDGASEAEAAMKAGHRVFGSKPGAYGAGLQALIDSGNWSTTADLGQAFLNWGQYAYGAHAAGTPERARFAARLGDIEAVVQNQDNREHDLLDSDDYYQFEGGLVATAESLTGRRPVAYHNDHSRPERPVARTLEEEISRVMRSRVVNPKWIDGVKRHGYKGAFEIIATVDYMFAFAATTGAVKTHHFDLAFEAFVEDEGTREFIVANNRFGWDEMIAKFSEARERGYWVPRSNSAGMYLTAPHPAASRPPSPQRGEGRSEKRLASVPTEGPPPPAPPLKGEGGDGSGVIQ